MAGEQTSINYVILHLKEILSFSVLRVCYEPFTRILAASAFTGSLCSVHSAGDICSYCYTVFKLR